MYEQCKNKNTQKTNINKLALNKSTCSGDKKTEQLKNKPYKNQVLSKSCDNRSST